MAASNLQCRCYVRQCDGGGWCYWPKVSTLRADMSTNMALFSQAGLLGIRPKLFAAAPERFEADDFYRCQPDILMQHTASGSTRAVLRSLADVVRVDVTSDPNENPKPQNRVQV
jgi:hypothetical protein